MVEGEVVDLENPGSGSQDGSYSAVVDQDADIRKRVQRTSNAGGPP